MIKMINKIKIFLKIILMASEIKITIIVIISTVIHTIIKIKNISEIQKKIIIWITVYKNNQTNSIIVIKCNEITT